MRTVKTCGICGKTIGVNALYVKTPEGAVHSTCQAASDRQQMDDLRELFGEPRREPFEVLFETYFGTPYNEEDDQ